MATQELLNVTATPDKNQQKYIEHPDGTVMVLAGAGTGKTFTIIERIKYMLSPIM